jgi:hypothetical protein
LSHLRRWVSRDQRWGKQSWYKSWPPSNFQVATIDRKMQNASPSW